MAKRKKGISENMRKKNVATVAVNKFELKINKQKNKVLGQKSSKHDRGMPGVSKSKSIKKRMETLLVDYQKSKRVNFYEDKRLEKKDFLDEDKELTRFKLKHKKASQMYNLDEEDEEEMTHGGQKISQLTTFDNPILSDDEDDEDEDGVKEKALANRYTEDNFGGGFLSRMKDEGGNEMSHKDRMAELVFQSIVDKNQRRKAKDEIQERIDDLNSKMKSVLPQLNTHVKRGDERKGKIDTLDVAVRMLAMMPRGTISEKVKSKEEIEKEEEERIGKEEEERQERMKAPSRKREAAHVSVDAHGDEFWLEGNKKIRCEGEEDEEEDDDDEGDSSSSEDESEEEEEDDEEEEEGEDIESKEINSQKKILKSEEDDDEDKDGDDDDDDKKKNDDDKKSGKGRTKQNGGLSVECLVERLKNKNAFLSDLSQLPKKDVESLMQFLKMKVNQNEVCDVIWDSMHDFINLMWRICRKDPTQAAKTFRHFIFDTQSDFLVSCDEKLYGSYPTNAFTFMLLQMISVTFPVSDFHHVVCTPFFILASQILTKSTISNMFDVAAGLQISFILSNCCIDDSRYLPEPLNFIHSVLLLHSQHTTEYKRLNERNRIQNYDLLNLNPKQKCVEFTERFRMRLLFEKDQNTFIHSTQFKVESLWLSMKCLSNFMMLYKKTEAFVIIFHPQIDLLKYITWAIYPKEFEELYKVVLNVYNEGCMRTLSRLKGLQNKPKGITFLEPVLGDKIGGVMAKDYEERKRTARKEKRKKKDEERKVKKDQSFLNQHVLNEKIARNKEREEKTRRIINDLAEQEGWYKEANKKRSLNIMADKKKEKIQQF